MKVYLNISVISIEPGGIASLWLAIDINNPYQAGHQGDDEKSAKTYCCVKRPRGCGVHSEGFRHVTQFITEVCRLMPFNLLSAGDSSDRPSRNTDLQTSNIGPNRKQLPHGVRGAGDTQDHVE